MTSIKKERLLLFDYARAISCLYIVAFLHILGYIPRDWWLADYTEPYIQALTYVVLSTFFFISGYFMGGYKINTIADVLNFYFKRFIRFYPLFVLASLLLLFISNYLNIYWYPNIKYFFLSLTGLTTLTYTQPATLWFICMLIFMYLLTPFFLKLRRIFSIYLSVFIYFIFVIEFIYIYKFDFRLLQYYPIYIVGLFVNHIYFEKTIKKPTLLFLSAILFLISIVYFVTVTKIIYPILIISGLIFLLTLSSYFSKYTSDFFIKISYASLCAYMFHRVIYTLIAKNYFINGFVLLNGVLIPLIVIGVFIISYYLQTIYDSNINKILIKK